MDKTLLKFKKLNFGCGWDKREGYINLDIAPQVEPDLLIVNNDYSMLPKNHYKEIVANDVLEHIPRELTLSTLLDWAEYLKMGGKLHLQTTSVLGVARQLKKNSFGSQNSWLTYLFGNQAHEGDYHFTSFTETTLKVYLAAAGFTIDSLEERDKWLFFVDAHKSYDWAALLNKCRGKTDEAFIKAAFREVLGHEPDTAYTPVFSEREPHPARCA